MTKKILAFLCVIALLLGTLTIASAETHMTMKGVKENIIGYEGNYYVLKNGKTATFYVHADYMSSLYPKGGSDWSSYRDILFDTTSPVKASCSADWVHITNSKTGFFLNYDTNPTQKNRKATVKIKGKDYSAKFILIQFGRNDFISVIRNKKTVTVKFKMAEAAKGGYLGINMYKYLDDGSQVSKYDSIEIEKGTTTVKFKVTAGWQYNIYLSGTYWTSDNYSTSNSTCSAYFEVTKENIGKKEQIYPRNY